MDYAEFFERATGKQPYDFQRRLALEAWPDFLEIPTGMGKTAAVVLAWLYKRQQKESGTPRRLVYCLPMRVLVEQTDSTIKSWLNNLGLNGKPGESKVSTHVLMGGESDLKTWAEHPEEDMILIGTQDMLLSRALMRGYGMSRFQWPIHFALLHNDCLWAFDEVQLMGAGLTTSAQLEAFRRKFPLAKNSRTMWLSATLNRDWLATVDLRPHLASFTNCSISNRDKEQAKSRLCATKTLTQASVAFTNEAGNKSGLQDYLGKLCELVLAKHDTTKQTLVIVNRVDRAQQLFCLLRERRRSKADLLIHARFRPAERADQARRLGGEPVADRIIVATQAIEAGVDITSKVLITELAPWASMVQRFGRCNRYGENNDVGANIFWVDIADDADALPYSAQTLAASRAKLASISSAGPQDLPATDEERPLTSVLRRRDLLDLFNTDPDLSGFDVDISDYIRDNDRPGLQVFWREFDNSPNDPQIQSRPERNELCPISISQAKGIGKRGAWYWDALGDKQQNGRWLRLDREPRPGMMLLLRAADGGYSDELGFVTDLKEAVVPLAPRQAQDSGASFADDWRSYQNKSVELADHLGHVADHAGRLCDALDEADYRQSVVRAGRWHDLGKLHDVFQKSMYRCKGTIGSAPLAKSDCKGAMRHERQFFRHELASTLGWLAQHDGEPDANLIAYLIAAHHGKVRMSLRAMPTEKATNDTKRFARGVWEGDLLPALDFDGEHSKQTTLKLALMEIGEGEQGASWAERTLKLLDQHGPFRLAWLETLVRLADWRASAAEQLDPALEANHNDPHGLDNRNSTVARSAGAGTAADSLGPASEESGAQHGLRGRTGGSSDAGSRTRPPHAATRHLDTTLGILSYTELAPHLALRVEALQNAIGTGEFDSHNLDESLFLAFHSRLCADLTPDFAGRWRKQEVIVGNHHPPLPFKVPLHMREYVQDLNARIQSLPATSNERWLETLAFAEGCLLSIHPFTDFNGRVTRVFIDWLTRRLNLPDVDPTPDAGEATERYLAALRAADRLDWQPLIAIWRERFEQGATP
jgi:CRISPR-associated endonuclease/helicase Cas3